MNAHLKINRVSTMTPAVLVAERERVQANLKDSAMLFRTFFIPELVGPGKPFKSYQDCELAPVGSHLKYLDEDKGSDLIFTRHDGTTVHAFARVIGWEPDITIRYASGQSRSSELQKRMAQWEAGTIRKDTLILHGFYHLHSEKLELRVTSAIKVFTAVATGLELEPEAFKIKETNSGDAKFIQVLDAELEKREIPVKILKFNNPLYLSLWDHMRQLNEESRKKLEKEKANP